ncbi:PAS domain S-box protein, partial [Candidatus Latescibacterota bacterium]
IVDDLKKTKEQLIAELEEFRKKKADLDSGEYTKKIIESSLNMIITVDKERRIFEFNKAACDTFGYTKEEILGKHINILYANEDEGRAIASQVIMKGSFTGEVENIRKNGEIFTCILSTSIMLGDYGEVIGAVGSSIDITERKKTELALKESEEKHRTLFETMLQGVVYQDAEGKIISANSAAERILGLTLDQMQGRTSINHGWKAIMDDGSDFPGDAHPAIIALKTGKKVKNVIMGIFNPIDKDYRWIIINAVPQFLPGKKKPYQVYTTFLDITEQKKSEEKLHITYDRLKKLESIINGSPAMAFLWPVKEGWPVEFVSGNVEDILGYTPEDFISGKVSWPGITHEDDIKMLEKEVANYLENNVTEFSQKYRLITKSGKVCWMKDQNKVLFDSKGNPTHIQSIILDITESNMADLALKESEEQYRTLVENINEAIYTVDIKGKITFISPAIESFLGYNPSHFMKKTFSDFVFSDDLARMKENFKKIIGGSNITNEYRLLDKDGKIRWVRTSSSPLYSDGNIIGLYGILGDITDLKLAEEDLKFIKNELLIKSKNLEESVTALKVLLKHRDSENNTLEENILSNINTLVIPYLEKIKINITDNNVKTYIDIVETNLTEITKKLTGPQSNYYNNLTPTEIRIAELIRSDKSSKEIADLLNISETTVFFHRRNIRNKLGLKGKKANLNSLLIVNNPGDFKEAK